MKVAIFNGSPRKEGNTHLCLKMVMDELTAEGIECDYHWIGMDKLHGCKSCYRCVENKDRKCSVTGDKLNEYLEAMLDADGIILGSPTYFANVTAPMKALIERAGLVSRVNGDLLKRKIGAGVVAVRRAGAAHVFSSLNYFFLISQMIVVGSNYWNLGIGKDPGDVLEDEEGKQIFKILGENFAHVLKKLHG